MATYSILSAPFDVETLLKSVPELVDPVRSFHDLNFDISPVHPVQYVLGGFGATGLPSLFHHPDLRNLRQIIYDAMMPVLAQAYPGKYIGMLIDRFGIRRKGTSISAESWHRDVSAIVQPGDIVLGGWLNLDSIENQFFTCVRGSELRGENQTGFVKFSADEMQSLETNKTVISIPPGHLVIFDQSIAHKITAKKQKSTSFRLYVGWRVSAFPFINTQLESFQLQTAPHLPSGQVAPMYAKLHWTNWRSMLQEFSSQFKPEFLLDRMVESGLDAGTVYRIVRFPMPGCIFPAYTESELALFTGRQFQ
jgi:hypothetical protein